MTVNLELSNKAKPNGNHSIFFRITKDRKIKRIDSQYSVNKSYWKKRSGQKRYYLSKSAPNYPSIENKRKDLEIELNGLLVENPFLSLEELLVRYHHNKSAVKSEIGFFNYAVAWALDLKAENRMGYFKKAHSTISNFASFVFKRDLKLIDFINGGEKSDLPFENISVKTLNDFEHWLKAKELKTNTVYGNLKTLRTIYYKAENEEIFETRKNPFRRKKLVQAKTTKKALSLEEIKLLENCQLSDDQLELARDMFLFSFYCSGLRWGDVCTLRWANIEGDVIKVIPRKTIRTTNAVMKIALHPKANSIIKKYRGDRGLRDWIFPLIEGEPEPNKIIGILGSKNAITNKLLKYVASTARVKKPISFHMARHSYATLAIQKNAPLQVISQLLGHSDLKTTQVYLKELDNDVTNAAHLNILDY